MNRLAPLITRAETLRPLLPRPVPVAALPTRFEIAPGWREDLQFFVTAWLGGLLFVGTLLG
jgi:hypothetical protein